MVIFILFHRQEDILEFFSNDGKNVEIEVNGVLYKRHAVITRFVEIGDSYTDLVKEYILPIYEQGDIVFSAEKVLSICSSNVIYPEDMNVGKWAIFLSGKVERTPAGMGLSLPLKMQYAIDTVGLPRILFAAGMSVIGKKIFRRKGWFYAIAGRKVTGIDGFGDAGQDENNLIGIPLPDNAKEICDEMYRDFGMLFVVTDTNDFSSMTLGASKPVRKMFKKKDLYEFVKDNPYGQENECTPFIIARKG